MARVNVGIHPQFLADQHLIAESVEITMITGQLKQHNWQIKSDIPKVFPTGKGHMTFFKNKLIYLSKRLKEVNTEMTRRGFNPGTSLDDVLEAAPQSYLNDWSPSNADSELIRARIESRLTTRLKGQPGQGYYRYGREVIPNISEFIENMKLSELNNV